MSQINSRYSIRSVPTLGAEQTVSPGEQSDELVKSGVNECWAGCSTGPEDLNRSDDAVD